MNLVITESYEESSRALADMLETVIVEKKDAILGLATGSSPIGMYQCLAEDFQSGKVDFSSVSTINLDEYIGLSKENPQSFRFFMDQHFFSKVNIEEERIHMIDGSGVPAEEIKKYNEFLSDHSIDFLVLGIGNNGHIGFNEPSDVFIADTHEVMLTKETIRANSRFFEKIEDVPISAVTMGMAGITRAKKVVLIASGKAKADAVEKLFADNVIDPMIPCSILKICRDVTVIVDRSLYERTKL